MRADIQHEKYAAWLPVTNWLQSERDLEPISRLLVPECEI